MKQPKDTKTIELQIDKRGRGRPAKEDKLTQAERAKRYREKQKANGIKSDVTKNIEKLKAENKELELKTIQKKFEFAQFVKMEQENEQLKRQLKQKEDELNETIKAIKTVNEFQKLSNGIQNIFKKSDASL